MAQDYGANGSISSSSTVIKSSNIGFQLLKKHGWKEGTGLGASEQGRLEPVETYVKNNKRGLGAEKVQKKIMQVDEHPRSSEKRNSKEKAVSKRMRKMAEREKQLQEKEFEIAFFREFWPENV
ncbi:G patch domain and ankyrin repeat-containing protein 1 homolog [Phyllobates terribilis]|uniref:G patch domain and ankyrin repeat-containing protein 1 homolog n=1 Tax=Phyllobates terribilis TaxID=111132 RepID=UPI003CCB2A1D